MAVENDFLPFAVGGAANVLTQAQYAALTTLLADGFQTGTAQSQQLNKVWRQGSIMAAVMGQLIADSTGQNVIDDGTVATIEANLARAIRGDIWNGTDTGAANAYAITLSPAPAALTPGMLVGIRGIVAGNTGASTFNLNGLGVLPIQGPGAAALQGGEFVTAGSAILQANAGATAWNLVWTSGAQPVAAASKSGQAVNLGQFPASLGSAGYVKFPNGLILQWNGNFTTSTAPTLWTFPIAFPNGIIMNAGSDNVGNVASSYSVGFTGGSPTGVSVSARNSANAYVSIATSIIVLGY